MKNKVKRILVVLVGLFLVSISFNLFLSPYNYVTGGVSGVAIIVSHFISLPISLFLFVVNLFLIGVSYLFLGREKTRNTVLGSILFPIFTYLTADIANWIVLDIDPFFVAILGGLLSGYGYGLVFQNNYTTGGTDILNQLMEKYMKIPMSKSIMIIDGTIVLFGGFVFGFTNLVYSLIVLVLISVFSNHIQLDVNKNRVLYITSDKLSDIEKCLIFHGYDVTILDSFGGYTKKAHKMILSSISSGDYYRIKEELLRIDPEIFIVVTNAYEQKNANVYLRNHVKADTQNI